MNRTGGVRKKKDLVGGGLLSRETRTCQLDKQEISSSRVILTYAKKKSELCSKCLAMPAFWHGRKNIAVKRQILIWVLEQMLSFE